jgi:hypothetical protein
MLVLGSKLLGVLGQERLLIFFGDVVFALLLGLWWLKHLSGTDISTSWRFWLIRSLWSLDGRFELQTARCILPNILTGEVMASKVRSLDLVGKSLGLLTIFLIFWEKRFVFLVGFEWSTAPIAKVSRALNSAVCLGIVVTA